MPLIADYAITPDVFDRTSYSTPAECEARIETIREAMLTEGLVRNLRAGAWRHIFRSDTRPWHRRGTELVKKLATQNRLVPFRSELPAPPRDDRSWCAEALATHAASPFRGGVIVTESVKGDYVGEPLVARIDRLAGVRWWSERSPSVTLARTLAAYETHLDLLLRHSSLLVFIDPYLDPAERQYRHVRRLLTRAGNRSPTPTIEIHRAITEEQRPRRHLADRRHQGQAADEGARIEHRFRDVLADPLRAAGLSAGVFIWSKFHDRFLLSNLAGVSLPYGFATATNVREVTRWTRLGRTDRDDVRREFHRHSHQHRLQRSFRIQ
ncbi:MAG: hypothetical protein OXH75_14690 [Acidobacteria bacterium]|nr:hypothetical protein [Acidobacteriota bacterium]